MNTNDRTPDGMNDGTHDERLLWQLRGLRREELPGNDLWPGIAARISQQAAPAGGGNVVALRRRHVARLVPLALAASLAAAVGVAWQLRPGPDVTAAPTAPLAADRPAATQATLIHREADAMTREYAAALRELQAAGRPAAPAATALRQLDDSAEQIRAALQRAPDAHFLLERLRHTYEKRLELTQRAILS